MHKTSETIRPNRIKDTEIMFLDQIVPYIPNVGNLTSAVDGVFLHVKCKIHYFLAIFCPLQPQCTVKKAWENKSFSQRVSLNFADDSVYMRTRAHLNEYLLNDVGKVYQGSYKTPIGRDWAFGQFEAAVLPAAFFLLDKSQLRPTERGNPIKVSRAISAMGKRHALKKLKQVTKNTGYFFWILLTCLAISIPYFHHFKTRGF